MFATTRWSLIAAASETATPEARRAIAELCEAYWFPIYAYIRRKGNDRHTAEDLTQGFFSRVLEKNDFAMANRARGRFRTFLLSSCQHFLANQHDYATAQKRGGGVTQLSWDFEAAEGRFNQEPSVDRDSAERLYERRWALELLGRSLNELQQEYRDAGKEAVFEVLKPSLTGDAGLAYELLADSLGMTIGAVKVAMHRLRQRYRDRIREVIGRTVANEAEIEEEIRDLFAALG